MTDIMFGLADSTRLEIVQNLYAQGRLTCSQLTGERPKSSMSHHFKILRETGIICTEVVGKEHYNFLRQGEINERFPGLLAAILQTS